MYAILQAKAVCYPEFENTSIANNNSILVDANHFEKQVSLLFM